MRKRGKDDLAPEYTSMLIDEIGCIKDGTAVDIVPFNCNSSPDVLVLPIILIFGCLKPD